MHYPKLHFQRTRMLWLLLLLFFFCVAGQTFAQEGQKPNILDRFRKCH
jgi:hypothetical protein